MAPLVCKTYCSGKTLCAEAVWLHGLKQLWQCTDRGSCLVVWVCVASLRLCCNPKKMPKEADTLTNG